VVDAVLKVDTPHGPCWRRYNHDGYGQRDDGSAYKFWGTGRAWPLLTGERGHYEIAAGHDGRPYLLALENFAYGVGLLPEQIWDAPDLPSRHLRRGGPTGAAVPLLWAHGEYVKLHRSVADRKVFDLIDPAYIRYVSRRAKRKIIEVWKFNRQVPYVAPGTLLRIQANSKFMLHWTRDEWQHSTDAYSQTTGLGIDFVDIPIAIQSAPIRFTFFWIGQYRWHGEDYTVEVHPIITESEAPERVAATQDVIAAI
jgi:glucoamylase